MLQGTIAIFWKMDDSSIFQYKAMTPYNAFEKHRYPIQREIISQKYI